MSIAATRRAAIPALTLLLVLTGCTVNPVTGERQLDLMGEAQELALGEQLYPQYTQLSLGEVPDGSLQRYVLEVGTDLARVSHRPDLPYEYNPVNEPMVNAYALPGGKISITRGLLARMGSEDELAGVLGHETGHVTARHASQQYTRTMLTQLALVGGMIAVENEGLKNPELYRLGAQLGASLLLARYSRDQERQSDELGMGYMVEAGYNPVGMVRLMETLASSAERQPGLLERMFASHPLTTNRIRAAQARIAELPAEVTNRPLQRDAFLRQTALVRRQQSAYDRLAEARAAMAQGRERGALGMLQQSVDEWPEDGVLRTFLAAAQLQAGDERRAMANAERAADDAPEMFYAQLVAGEVFVAAQRWDAALQHLNRAQQLLPNTAEVVLLAGHAFEGQRRGREAVQAYARVRELAPPDSRPYRVATDRLRRLGALR